MWTERDLQTMLDPQIFYHGRLIELTGGVYSFETYKSTSEYGDLQLILSQKFGTKMSVPTLWK